MAGITKEQKDELDRMIPPLAKRKPKKKPKRKKPEQPFQQPTTSAPAISPELMKQIMSGEAQLTQEQAAAIVMTSLTDRQIIDMHSDLSEIQIMTLTAMSILSEIYDEKGEVSIYGHLIKVFEPKMVSKDRQGRKELIDMVKALAAQKQQSGLMDRFRSLF